MLYGLLGYYYLFYFQPKYFLYVVVVIDCVIFRGEVLAHSIHGNNCITRREKEHGQVYARSQVGPSLAE